MPPQKKKNINKSEKSTPSVKVEISKSTLYSQKVTKFDHICWFLSTAKTVFFGVFFSNAKVFTVQIFEFTISDKTLLKKKKIHTGSSSGKNSGRFVRRSGWRAASLRSADRIRRGGRWWGMLVSARAHALSMFDGCVPPSDARVCQRGTALSVHLSSLERSHSKTPLAVTLRCSPPLPPPPPPLPHALLSPPPHSCLLSCVHWPSSRSLEHVLFIWVTSYTHAHTDIWVHTKPLGWIVKQSSKKHSLQCLKYY